MCMVVHKENRSQKVTHHSSRGVGVLDPALVSAASSMLMLTYSVTPQVVASELTSHTIHLNLSLLLGKEGGSGCKTVLLSFDTQDSASRCSASKQKTWNQQQQPNIQPVSLTHTAVSALDLPGFTGQTFLLSTKQGKAGGMYLRREINAVDK
ncbi:hypothetical protein ILYODFUR_006278 [Ilyodon furcidens]|uniref:Uncharacterized protein n=1 Tax=Ilyodon furcidens TaxID=33524 RepID=A0ABV0UEA5_9TELE